MGEALKSLKTREGRRTFFAKYKEPIMYVVFGVGTTLVSFVAYYLFRFIFPSEDSVPRFLRWIFNITSAFGTESATALPVILSWIASVTFAYITNRLFVFESRARGFGGVLAEAAMFYLARAATLLVDLVIMFLMVDLTGIDGSLYEFFAKCASSVVVLILNYVLSKLIVFRKK